MAVVTSYQLQQKMRDLLNTALNQVIQESPSFINLFGQSRVAIQSKHEWLSHVIKRKEIAYASATNVGVFTVTSAAGWTAGDYVHIKGSSAVLKIASINDAGTAITTTFVNAAGSGLTSSTIPTGAGILVFDSHPVAEGSTTGKEVFEQGGTEWNQTQIFRYDVKLSGSTLATRTYDNANGIDTQTAHALQKIANELNHVAIRGIRQERSASENGMAGGLYFFGTQSGCLGVNANNTAVSAELINDAAQNIIEAGCNPSIILCGSGMRRAISSLPPSMLSMIEDDRKRGSYVDGVICDANGQVLKIMVDSEIPDTDLWVLDPTGLERVPLQGREMIQKDIRNDALDGQERMVLGEMTLVFPNAKQRLCRVRSLEDPSITTSHNYGPRSVRVVASTLDVPLMTATKKNSTTVTLAWGANSNAARWEVRYATTEVGLTSATQENIAYSESGTDVGSLTANTSYCFQIRAVGDGINTISSGWSAVKTAKTDAA